MDKRVLNHAYAILVKHKLLSAHQIIERMELRFASRPSVREMSQSMQRDSRFVSIRPIGERVTLWKPRL